MNGGAVNVVGGTPTVANVSLIQVFGQAGNDTITLDEANGVLPKANLFGGAGNDTPTGGSAPTSSSARRATTSCSARVARTEKKSFACLIVLAAATGQR